MKKSRKNKKLLRAILKSALIVSCLLLLVLTGSIFYLIWSENQTPDANQIAGRVTHARPARTGDAETAPTPETESEKSGQISGADTPRAGTSAQKKQKQPSAADTTLLFAGDVYFSDYVLANYNQSGISGVLSNDLLAEMKQADITMVNNEFPYSDRGTPAPDKQFTFRIAPAYVSILKESGVDLVTLANNHVLDYGRDALNDTFQTLREAGIRYAGAGNSLKRAAKLITKKANGHTFGFLAASRVFPEVSWNVENAQPGVLSAYDPSLLIAAVESARQTCDFLCVYVHWGIERNTSPEQYQITMAHALIDAGADAVIGAHPHVLQGVEIYQEKPIFYSLGNFIFYQSIERTAVAKLTFTADRQASWQLLPAKAAGACTSLLTEPEACLEFYEYLSGLSYDVTFSADGTVAPKRNEP